jgi:hypothetical protein
MLDAFQKRRWGDLGGHRFRSPLYCHSRIFFDSRFTMDNSVRVREWS